MINNHKNNNNNNNNNNEENNKNINQSNGSINIIITPQNIEDMKPQSIKPLPQFDSTDLMQTPIPSDSTSQNKTPHDVERAALLGDTELLMKLINNDWSLLELEDDEKNTPLLLATREGHILSVTSLLQHGANFSVINKARETIMTLSLPHQDLYLYLQEKKEIFHRDGEGNTLLHKECYHSRADQVINLLSKGASVNVLNKDGNTPLHLSLLSAFALERTNEPIIQAERVEKIRLIIENLIERGADLNITNKKLQTPLSLIASLGFEKLRLAIGTLMFSNRGEISRGWVRYHYHTALSLYHGDFHHTSNDQDILDLHVGYLTGFSLTLFLFIFL